MIRDGDKQVPCAAINLSDATQRHLAFLSVSGAQVSMGCISGIDYMTRPKNPTKRERDRMLVDHNVPQLIKSVAKVRKAANKLDCALAEMNLYAEIIAPFAPRKRGTK